MMSKSKSGRSFHEKWTVDYGVVQKNNKALCCLCNETVASRSFNVKRHFETIHTDIFSLSKLKKSWNLFRKDWNVLKINQIISKLHWHARKTKSNQHFYLTRWYKKVRHPWYSLFVRANFAYERQRFPPPQQSWLIKYLHIRIFR